MPLLAATVASGHTGVPRVRTGPEPSDIGLFVVAVVAVGFVRHRMRSRKPRD